MERGWFNMEQDFREMDRSEFVKTLRSHYGLSSEVDNNEDRDWEIIEQWECLLDGTFIMKPEIK
jgi:predicted secreted protein